ncbi:MBL fold metallo-hydrolase RNA specificity domain-containing protein [Desulfonatronum thiodismutans]|uniref:MBL fold metallo-hydrolase RNA specificity domain-containing protein n=1 Tax=Desulfonatronum thiodismutans TaxID=159290 RepID=UPI0006919712|nr:MBL fold metallo-hydrolase [Desulfonatronum thiodismutans]
MKVRFLGAARTVTGSCIVVETSQTRFAVDCGLYQGNREIEKRNQSDALYDPSTLDFILITHAHIDHSGLLPRIVNRGFAGPVYATPPTKDLLEIMLLDSAHIQEMEARWENKKRLRVGQKPIEPLYGKGDVSKAMSLVQSMVYNDPFDPGPGVRVNFKDAGHILGSALVEVWVEEDGQRIKLVFSGDLGRPDQLLVRDPSIVESADFLFMESTYGNRDHKNEDQSREELAEAIAFSYAKGEKVIIPAFALERTQEVIFSMFLLSKEGKLPKDMPVFVDSPLATRATEVFRRHPDYFDRETRHYLANGEDPFNMPNLRFTLSVQESQALNTMRGPAVIISASGMANAGRVKHHLKHNLWRQGASIVFVGFQAMGTPGRKIVDGAESIRILGEDILVKARVFTIGGFSAHAGQSQLMDWLSFFRSRTMEVFLIHGEYEAQKVLAGLIRERFRYTVHIPDFLDESILTPGKVLEQPRDKDRGRSHMDWDFLVQEMERPMVLLRERIPCLQALPWVEQTEMRDRVLDVNRIWNTLVSDIPCGHSRTQTKNKGR